MELSHISIYILNDHQLQVFIFIYRGSFLKKIFHYFFQKILCIKYVNWQLFHFWKFNFLKIFELEIEFPFWKSLIRKLKYLNHVQVILELLAPLSSQIFKKNYILGHPLISTKAFKF